jgi:uncharacterized membrane protein
VEATQADGGAGAGILPLQVRFRRGVLRWAASFGFGGLVVGWIFLNLSMTPSLLPRGPLLQGILSGIATAFGYGIGVGLLAIWRYLELPEPPKHRRPLVRRIVFAALAVATIWYMAHLVDWQNNLRRIFGMDRVNDITFAVVVVLIALVVAVLLIALSRLIARVVRRFARWGSQLVPRRVGRVLGFAVGIALVVFLVNGVLLDSLVGAAQQAFSIQNGRHEAGVDQPTSPLRSGSPESLATWDSLGQPGRKWVARGPTAEQINGYSGGGATEPIRVYIGLDSADSVEERADLALEELKRTGGFDREVLVIATSTGSGGIDPNGTRAIEYMHNGDTAIAGFQYSYLPSWISYFVDQASAKEASTTFFETIHDHWRELDPDERPDLYLFGVSLGSFGSEASSASIRSAGAPINGAVWAGPTFMNEQWVLATRNRDAGSPAWLPVYDDGRVIRFTNGTAPTVDSGGDWGETRVVYIQHPSDPVSFFSFDLLLEEPEWLSGERSPETSPDMNWYPGVTFWQVALDLPTGGGVPPGFGHNMGIPAYVAAWAGVSEPPGWTPERADQLEQHLDGIEP